VPVSGLRPVVFGGPVSTTGAALSGPFRRWPELILSVHGEDDDILGYAVVDRVGDELGWGGRTIGARLPVEDVCAWARAATLQLKLFELTGSTHHSHVVVAPGAGAPERARIERSFDERVRELVGGALLEPAFCSEKERITPEGVEAVAVSVAVSIALAALEEVGLDCAVASCACDGRGTAELVAATLWRHGARLLPRRHAATADVLLVSNGTWSPTTDEVARLRAAVVIALVPLRLTTAAEAALHRRGILVVPDTLAGSGRLLGAYLGRQGLSEEAAAERAVAMALDGFESLQTSARLRDEPLTRSVRDRVNQLAPTSA
jgi:hypothetical protein